MSTRRNFILFGAGAGVGTLFTPVWKLVDDASIWTQNWGWLPQPPRGPLAVKHTACTLCPSACAVQARCCGDQPYGIAAVAADPQSRGMLCQYAPGAHHMAWHPSRLKTPLLHGKPATFEEAAAFVAAAARGRAVVVVDEAPGRPDSAAYARWCEQSQGTYVPVGAAGASSCPRGTGLDATAVRAVLAFGAPVLDGSAMPHEFVAAWCERKLHMVFAGPELSHTAAMADRYLAIRPASEGAAALAIAKALAPEALPMVELSTACGVAGVSEAVVRQAAGELRAMGSAVALSGGGLRAEDEAAIAVLNAVLGTKAFVKRPAGTALDDVQDESAGLVLVDAGLTGGRVPAQALRRKLAAGGVLAVVTPYRAGAAESADLVVPAPAWLEALDAAGTPWHGARPSYTVAPALLPKPEFARTGPELLGEQVTRDELARERVREIFAGRSGDVFAFASGESQPVASFESEGKLWEAFAAGARWTGAQPDAALSAAMPANLAAIAAAVLRPVTGMQLASNGTPAVLPPLACKLDCEAPVYRNSGLLYLNPQDARGLGLERGAQARVESGGDSRVMKVAYDATLLAGTAVVAAADKAERYTQAQITKV